MKKTRTNFKNIILVFFVALVPCCLIISKDFDIKKGTPKELCESIQNIFNNSKQSINSTIYELREFFQNQNIDINIKDEQGNTTLHFAAQKACNNVIKLLSELRAKIDARATETIMPDWDQIKNDGNIRIKYSKLNEKDFNKLDGFFIAKYIIKKYQSNNNRRACKFKNLFYEKHKEEYLSQQPFSKQDIIQLKIKNCTPLHDAICNGFYDTAKLLIELGADINRPLEHEFTIILPKKKNKKNENLKNEEKKIYSKIIRLEINPKNIAKNREYTDIEAMIEENKGLEYVNTKIEDNNPIQNENQ